MRVNEQAEGTKREGKKARASANHWAWGRGGMKKRRSQACERDPGICTRVALEPGHRLQWLQRISGLESPTLLQAGAGARGGGSVLSTGTESLSNWVAACKWLIITPTRSHIRRLAMHLAARRGTRPCLVFSPFFLVHREIRTLHQQHRSLIEKPRASHRVLADAPPSVLSCFLPIRPELCSQTMHLPLELCCTEKVFVALLSICNL
jgi:hypothetical protein